MFLLNSRSALRATPNFAFLFASLLWLVLSCATASAQPVTLDRFPNDSDVTAEQDAQQSIDQVQQNFSVGEGIGNQFATDGGKFDAGSGRYQKHPWRNPIIGRNPIESYLEWFTDSKYLIGLGEGTSFPSLNDWKTFQECIEPRMILPICPMYCWPMQERFDGSFTSCPVRRNMGYLFAYWWPEAVIELNNFGTYSLNPLMFGRVDLMEPLVTIILKAILEPLTDIHMLLRGGASGASFPGGLRADPNLGQTHYAGLLPGDQTLVTEAHVARTYVANNTSKQRDETRGELDFIWKKKKFICIPIFFWYNGYKKGNKQCWFSTHPEEGAVIHAYTESPQFALYWRFPEFSALSEFDANDLYDASVPMSIPLTPKGMIVEGLIHIGSYAQRRSCASYRAEVWQDRYEDLEDAFVSLQDPIPGIIADDWDKGNRICYYGGGTLYPPIGTMVGHFSPLPSAAYFARRALYVAAHVNHNNPTNIFSDRADKLQRVFPEPGECFRVNDIDEYNRGLFPKDAVRPDQLGSIRYVYWNMRVACVCEYRGGYPIPFLPSILWPFPIGEGCHNWFMKDDESKGNEEHQGIQGFSPWIPWPYFWPILPVPYSEAMWWDGLYPADYLF